MVMLRETAVLAGLVWMTASGFAADERVVQAFGQGGAPGVVSLAKALAKDEGTAAAVEALSSAMQHRNLRLRAAAAHALGAMGEAGRRAWPEVAASIGGDGAVEMSQLLNELGPGDIPLWLVEAALHPDDVSDAYEALQYIGLEDDRVVPILQKGLEHSDLGVQWRAVVLLGEMGAKAAPARAAIVKLLETEPTHEKDADEYFSPNQVRAKAAFALGCIGAEPDQTVALLAAMLEHADPEIRKWSALGLGRMEGRAQAAVPALVDCLTDEVMILRPGGCIWSAHPDHCAATALVGIGPPAIPAIIEALSAEQAVVRLRAADSLWFFGAEQAQPAVAALFQRLDDPDAAVRRTAAYVLGWIAPKAENLVTEMVRLTRDADPDVRKQAMSTLEGMERQEAIPLDALLPLLNDPDSDVRAEVLGLLDHRVPSAIIEPAIRKLLQAPESSARESAARMLARIGREAKWAAPALVELLKDEDSMVRYAAVESLAEIGPEAASVCSALVELLKDERSEVRADAIEALGNIGPAAEEATTAIVWLLNDQGEYVRPNAVTALAKIGPATKVVPALTALLEDSDIRRETVEALGELGTEARTSFPMVVKLLDDDESSVRLATIRTLERIGPPQAVVPLFIEALKDNEPDVRYAAAESLGEMGRWASASLPAMSELLHDEDPSVCGCAARAIGKVGPAKSTVPVLTKLLGDSDPSVRHAAIESLGDLGPAAVDACPALVELLHDDEVRVFAALALGKIDSAAASVPAMMQLLKVDDLDVRCAAAEGLGAIGPGAATAAPALMELLEDKERRVCVTAATALGKIGQATVAVPVLIQALQDEDVRIRSDAAWGLGEIGPAAASAAPALLQSLQEGELYVGLTAMVLAKVSPSAEAVPVLMKLLKCDDAEERIGYAEALGKMGSVAAASFPALVESLQDRNRAVRTAAILALAAIGPASETVPLITTRLRDMDPRVQCAAAATLGKIGPDAATAVPPLVELLRTRI